MIYNQPISIEPSDVSAFGSLNREPNSTLRGYIDGTITCDGMPNDPTPDEVMIFREHPVYAMRKQQLEINLLGVAGGRPYVNARLSRFSGETPIDWIGGQRPDGTSSTGRLQQTHCFPHLGRLTDKVNQYVFMKDPRREGGEEDFLMDVTRDGKSMNAIMRQVSSYYMATKWCWIGIDAPMQANGRNPTIKQKELDKIQPYLQVYSPLDIPDWKFDDRGGLEWVKTIGVEYIGLGPSVLPVKHKVVKIWEKGQVTKYTILEKQDRRFRSGMKVEFNKEVIPLTIKDVVPFVLVGEISPSPIPFDDLESINRTIMDLGSVNRANFFNCSYPQMVLPLSMVERNVTHSYAQQTAEIARMVIGFKYPIMEDKEDKDSRYISPDAATLGVLRDEIKALKQDLFEVAGMSLEKETHMVESGDARAWNFIDVSAVMRERSKLLEEAENKCAEIINKWDPSIPKWEVKYNTEFDTGNFKEELEALIMTGNISQPVEMVRVVLNKILERLDKIGAEIPDDEKEKIVKAIETWDPEAYAVEPLNGDLGITE